MSACDDYRSMVPLFLDNELSGDDAEEFRKHVASCADCRQLLEEEQALSRLFHRARPLSRASDVLRMRVSGMFASKMHTGLIALATSSSSTQGSAFLIRSVPTPAGAMALTRTRSPAKACAVVRVRFMTAALDEAYAERPPVRFPKPATDAMLITDPPPDLTISGITKRRLRNVPKRSTRNSFQNSLLLVAQCSVHAMSSGLCCCCAHQNRGAETLVSWGHEDARSDT
jgi:hypothetical protein